MSSVDCGTVRDRIPDVAADRADRDTLATVEAHAAACEECSAELRLVRMLASARPRIPVDLTQDVLDRRRERQGSGRRPWWGISAAAAAVAALALGIGITSMPSSDVDVAAEVSVDEEEGELWLSDDGVLAGAPVLETLSDEALAQLLDELVPMTQGGQA